MADINVSLGLDDSKFKQGISNAQNSAAKLGNQMNTSFGGGASALTKFGQGVDALNVKFANLGRVVVGIGLASFITKALHSAEAIQDVSGALGVATAQLLEMELAANIAGGNLDALAGMVGRLEDNMQSAIDGNQKMRDSLAAVGIGFDEISQLTPDQVFNRIAKALGSMTDVNKRAALATELLGKSGRTFDWNAYTETILKVAGTQDKNAEAVRKADLMMERFGQTMRLVSAEFLNITGPIIEFLTPLNETSTAMERAQVGAKALAGALAIFAASSLVRGISIIVNGFRGLAAILGVSTAATAANTGVTNINTASAIANADAQVFMAGAHARVGAATAAVAVAELRLNSAKAAGVITSAEMIALENALTAARTRLSIATEAAAITQGTLTAATQTGTAANIANAASGGGILAFLGKYKVLLGAVAAGIAALTFSSSLNQGEDKWADQQRKSAQLLKRRKDALATLTEEQKKNYNALSQDQKNAVIDSIVAQAEMKKQADLQSKVYGKTKPTGSDFKPTEEATRKAQAITDAYNKQKLAIEQLQNSIQQKNKTQFDELKMTRDNLLLSERDRAIKKESLEFENRNKQDILSLKERERELSVTIATGDADSRNQAKAQLPLVQQEIKRLTESRDQERAAIERSAAATYDAVNAERTRANIAQFTADQRIQAEQKVRDLQDEIAKQSMTEIEKKYYDIQSAARDAGLAKIASLDAENAANKRALLTEQQKLEIMKAASAESGKLKDLTRQNYESSRSFSTGWKRAFNDYVENATNAAQRAENLFKTATRGMEEAIVNFAKTGKFEWRNFVSMMLEELLRSQVQQLFANMLGNMRNTMGSSLVRGESGGIPTGSSILTGIAGLGGSILKGIGGLFGGFFADGGQLGAGRWGIAGENGPEIISGPATVTPMSMAPTMVTYNIQAVDAASFKQLVARDPSFIYAVTQQGAKSIASTRR